ncbi:hypothetical protein Tco_1072529 [Tanacetum coccineum]
MNRLKIDKLTKAHLVGTIYELLNGTCQSSNKLEYNIEECYKALSDQLDWNNPEGDRCPFDLSKPLPLKGRPGHLTLALTFFFNNNLEYLKSSDPEKKYQLNKFSRHDVYSSMKILSVKSVTVNKLHDYSYLEEIVVKRADRQLYKFKEGNFVNLHLNDIKDMLLLVVQHKLFHLDGEVIVELALTMRMFTKSLNIKKRVEDLQLGVESYQKKINITKTQKDFPRISVKKLYTPSFDPPGVVYADSSNQKRLIRTDELYKLSDETLNNWSATDKKRAGIMDDLIAKLMLERRIIRNLERLMGERELEIDYRLMQRSV